MIENACVFYAVWVWGVAFRYCGVGVREVFVAILAARYVVGRLLGRFCASVIVGRCILRFSPFRLAG